MPKITPFLWFDNDAEEAMNFYTSIFPNSKVLDVARSGDTVTSATFELEGQQLIALNGGPHFEFSEAISFFVNCEDQAEVDNLWERLLDGGGKEQQCGWLKDKYGLSWQVIPSSLQRLLGDPDPEKSKRVFEAMMKMVKLDVDGLQRAYDGT